MAGRSCYPGEVQRFYNTSATPGVSANNTYAWDDTNHNDPTHAALWTGKFSRSDHAAHPCSGIAGGTK